MLEAVITIGVTVALLIGAYFFWQWLEGVRESWRQAQSRQPMANSGPHPPPTPETVLGEVTSSPAPEPSPARPTAPAIAKRFQLQLRGERAGGADLKEAFTRALVACQPDLEEEAALVVCAEMGYTAEELARLLAARGYPLKAIAVQIDSIYRLSEENLAVAIMPVIPNGEPLERAQQLCDAIGAVWDDASRADHAPQLTALGCTPIDVATFCYGGSEGDPIGELIAKLRKTVALDPAAVAEVICRIGIDPTDSDHYDNLRDEALTFEEAADVFCQCGWTVAEILQCETAHSSDSVFEPATALVAHGTPAATVFEAVIGMDDGPEYAEAVEWAVERKLDCVQIGAILRQKGVDAEELDEELRERDVDFRSRIEILHTMVCDAPTAIPATPSA